jgi:two-component system chemotaxis response regulator CheB
VAKRDLVLVGASLGGLEAIQRLLSGLPKDFKATVLFVLHIAPNSLGYLSSILQRSSTLPVAPAADGEPLRPGHVFVAVPDHHLMIEGDRMRLTRGPRESHARPSIDVLFRSAAYHAGPRAIGVVLSGKLDDGTAGLWAIKDKGGIAIVQSPDEAAYPAMPSSALRHVAVDYTLTIEEIAERLPTLTQEAVPDQEPLHMENTPMQTELEIAHGDRERPHAVRNLGSQSFYSCPECHGTMVRIQEGPIQRFRCHTGHAFSIQALAAEQPDQVEKALWSALAQIEEHYELLREMEASSAHPDDSAAYASRARDVLRVRDQIRELTNNRALHPDEATGT